MSTNDDFFSDIVEPMRYRDVMIDIETLGIAPNAAIVSIGAVTFDMQNLKLGQHYHVTININTYKEHKLDIDPATLKWWMGQGEQARKDFLGGEQLSLTDALFSFSKWLDENSVAVKGRGIWGNGANFDPVILTSAYALTGIALPWEYWGVRCFRTLKSLYPNVEPGPRNGTHHNALDDAVYQAEHIFKIRRHLRGQA